MLFLIDKNLRKAILQRGEFVDKQNIIVEYLTKLFPDAVCELNFSSPFELLIAVVLSAQCTDKRVNDVTKVLFAKYKNAQELANAKLQDVEEIIKPCGLYKNKAKHIVSASKDICEKFGGDIPKQREQIESLAGVGRKTANVVLSNLYNENVIAVDTHVLRVSNRLGLANTKSPLVCEKSLNKVFAKNLKQLHHRMVLFGRYYCKAKNPKCSDCELKTICKYYKG
ncbi:MAG: endonuclease III [Clostridia bacterium]|nr:endonuclease III [Clostridia bacterium]